MKLSGFQTNSTYNRWREREKIRTHNLHLIAEHRYFDIDSPQRIKKFLSRRGLSDESNELFPTEKSTATLVKSNLGLKQYLNLERILGANDLVNIYFLEDALHVSKTVGRIWLGDDAGMLRGYGNGFMVSPTLLLTNHHVLPDAATAGYSKVEFNYQLDDRDHLLASELFMFDPETFYYASETLDFALVAVKSINASGATLSQFGYNRLSKEEGKVIISQWLNIIQHPSGMPKQVGLRGNQLIDVLDNFLHYKTDTAPGSSGSPVYNERWEVVALHHSGVWSEDVDGNIVARDGKKWNAAMGEDQIKWIANEGVRISSILKHLEQQHFEASPARLLSEVFNSPVNRDPDAASISGLQEMGINKNTSAVIHTDGTLSCTFPVSVLFKTKDLLTAQAGTPVSLNFSMGASVEIVKPPNNSDILTAAKTEFAKWKDVVALRMGYVFKNGWITNERAVVITVKKRKSLYELQKEGTSPLPDQFLGYPVEVTGPTAEELIAIHFGQSKLESFIHPLPPDPLEILYVPPVDGVLKTITKKMKVLAHVSPEEGWKNLKPFLTGTQKTLTVAMYDFGARHILDAVEFAAKKDTFDDLTLTIQPGEDVGKGTKANDLKDEEVVAELKNQVNAKFHTAWIPIGTVHGWVASSYHIKVAVKDHAALWLSSGNWQSSNQPELEKLEDISPAFLLRNYNREWHVIVENEELAQTYELFIQNDYEHNKNYKTNPEEILDELNFLIPVLALELKEETTFESFKPFSENRSFKITPLLTPDNFYDALITFVNSAETELLIQNQTFNAPNIGQVKLEQLITAVLKKQQQGVDVKIIFRIISSVAARKNLEKLMEMGFDKNSIKVQWNCHTKGVIVDKQRIMIGSQNWSNDGVSVNRDASLIFYDNQLALYFRSIFLHDWEKLARYNIGREAFSLELATDKNNIPKGMEVMSWAEIRELV
jgi:V8-like Glu-specific endopeptidase